MITQINDRNKNNPAFILDGKALISREILKLVRSSTNCLDWRIDSTAKMKPIAMEGFKRRMNIKFDSSNVFEHILYKEKEKPEDIDLIIILAFPGYYYTEIKLLNKNVEHLIALLDENELYKYLENHCQTE